MDVNRHPRQQTGNSADPTLDIETRLAGHIPASGSRAARGRTQAPATTTGLPLGFAGRTALGAAGDLRVAMVNAAAVAAAEVRRRTRRVVAVVLATILSLGGVILPAAALVVQPSPSFGGFEVDGNMVLNRTGTIDWANSGAIPVPDDLIDSAFQGSSKELDPANWVCQSKLGGVTPGKDNLLRAYVNPRISGTSAYLDLAFVRQEGEGDTHINFEFNKSGVVAPYAEGPCPIPRAVGDLLFTYDFGGTSDPTSTVRVWRWNGSDWLDLPLPVNAAAATNNAAAITDPLNGDAVIPPRTFGELSVDLSLIPGFAPSCPGLGFVNVRSRSSGSSFTSALQDKLPTTAVDLSTCGSIKLKKVDDKGQPLAGATFGLYAGTNTTVSPVLTCLTDATGICSFPVVAPGAYTVKEISAPAGYTPSPTPIPVTVSFRQAVDLTGDPVTNPLILGAVKIVKTNTANGAPVAGIKFQLLNLGTSIVAKTRSGSAAECTTAIVDGVASCTIDGMVPGTYTLHEVASTVPATMTAVADQTVVVTGGETLTVNIADPVKPRNIELTKKVNGLDAVTIHSGDPVTYTLVAKNTGDVPIDVTSLTDSTLVGTTTAPVVLPAGCLTTVTTVFYIAPGASQDLCSYKANPTDDVKNTAVVVGTDEFGRTATDDDSVVVDVIKPAITLVKTVNGVHSITVTPDTPLSYLITITNTGDTNLTVDSFTDVETTRGTISTTCPQKDAVLAVGAVATCTYTSTAPSGGVSDTAAIFARDSLGRVVDANDTAVVIVLTPGLTIDKLVNGHKEVTVHEGDTLNYSITVKNTGDAPLVLTAFTDQVGIDPATVPADCAAKLLLTVALAPGGTRTCAYSVTAGQSDRPNTAIVTGFEPVLKTTLRSQSTALAHVIKPQIDIAKTVTPTQAHEGDPVSYNLVITNPGTTAVTLTALSDVLKAKTGAVLSTTDILKSCKFSTLLLEPGQSVLCTYAGTARADDTTNRATVTAVDSLGGDKGTVTDFADAALDVIHPAIELTKTVSPAVVHSGNDVTYTITIKNTGDTPLKLLTLTDQVTGSVLRNILDSCGYDTTASLQPSEVLPSCTYVTKTGTTDIENIAIVRAIDIVGGVKGTVTDDGKAVVEVLNPGIHIEKTASPTAVHPNDLVTYHLVITNTGDTPLTVTRLSDLANGANVLLSQQCLGLVGDTLGLTDVLECDYTVPAGTADIHNVATVVGVDKLTLPVSDDDFADVEVLVPSILVTKDADRAQAHPTDVITYTVTITNTGDTPLRLTSLTDAVNGGAASNILEACNLSTETVLDPGASTLPCTYTAVAGTVDLNNVVLVTAVDKLGKEVRDDDPAFVEVIEPAIVIDKTVDKPLAHAGDTLTYTLVVTNTGDTALKIISLDDAVNGAPASSLAQCGIIGMTLEAKMSVRCVYTATAGVNDTTNVAKVSGIDVLNKKVTDDDDAVVDVLNPAITIDKSVDQPLVHTGDSVTYTLVITNTGDTPLTITALDDAVNGAPADSLTKCGVIGKVLDPKGTFTCNYTAVTKTVDLRNVATVVGKDKLDKSVTDDDDATVDVTNPGIEIVKTVDKPVVHVGDTVTYTLVITNTGSHALTITALDDAVNGAPANSLTACGVIGKVLAAKASVTCSYTAVAGTVDLVNVATVKGKDTLDKVVVDDDDAVVDVVNPAITIVKTANVSSISGTSGPVVFQFLVTNTGDTALTDIKVTDDILGDIGTIARLSPGESASLTKAATVREDRPENIGKASGKDVLGKVVEATDNELITFVQGEVLVRPLPESAPPAPAPAPAPRPLARTGVNAARQLQVALTLIVLGGIAVLPERIRRRRRLV